MQRGWQITFGEIMFYVFMNINQPMGFVLPQKILPEMHLRFPIQDMPYCP